MSGELSGLPRDELEAIFWGTIVKSHLKPKVAETDVPAQEGRDHPLAVFVAGQPAAHKNRMEPAVRANVDLVNPVVIDADAWRDYHGDYKRWARENDLLAAARTHAAVAWWVDKAIEYVASEGLDVLVSATLKSPSGAQEKIAPFRDVGYEIAVVFMAVHEVNTRIGVVKRYLGERTSNLGYGRYVPRAVHDDACTGVLDTAQQLDRGMFGDLSVAVYQPGIDLPQYVNQREGGRWVDPPRTRAAIVEARERYWNHNVNDFRLGAQTLLSDQQLAWPLREDVTEAVVDLLTRSPVCLAIPAHP